MSVWADISSFFSGLMDWLSQNQADPATYLFVFFIFCILAAIILPIPIEVALIGDPGIYFPLKVLVLAFGKATGAVAVFFIGEKIEETISKFQRWGWFRWLLVKSEKFVRRYGYYALFAIMSIPFMIDTIPLYIFSLLNKEGKLLSLRGFALTNLLAGFTRGTIIGIIIYVLGYPM